MLVLVHDCFHLATDQTTFVDSGQSAKIRAKTQLTLLPHYRDTYLQQQRSVYVYSNFPPTDKLLTDYLTIIQTLVMSILNENELNDAIVSTLMKSAYGGNVSHQVDLAYRYLTGYGFDQSIMDGYAAHYL